MLLPSRLIFLLFGFYYGLFAGFITAGIPLLLQSGVWYEYSMGMVVSITVGCTLYGLSTIVLNLFTCYVLYKTSTEQRNNLLYFCMVLGDLLVPLFLYPLQLTIWWIFKQKDTDISFRMKIFAIYLWFSAFAVASLTFSIYSMAMRFLTSIYEMFRPLNNVWLKILCVLLPSIISIVNIFFEHMENDYRWAYTIVSVVTMYIPLVVMTSSVIVILLLRRITIFRGKKSPERWFLLLVFYGVYFVLWLPYFIYLPVYLHTEIVNHGTAQKYGMIFFSMVMLKLYTNFFIFNTCDDNFYNKCCEILPSCFYKVTMFNGTQEEQRQQQELAVQFCRTDEQALIDHMEGDDENA